MILPRLPATFVTVLFLSLQLASVNAVSAQQVADTAFRPRLGEPAFPAGMGPRVVLDEAHFNFHTLSGRYQTFARVLRGDGFVVQPGTVPFSTASLDGVDVLVIANALDERNVSPSDWSLPTPPAFTTSEVTAVREWVEVGGSLLLIADHMPFPGAAAELAASFGFELMNGFAIQTEARSPIVFRTSDGSLADHAVVQGRGGMNRVDSVASFTGEAFRAPPEAISLLTFPEGVSSLNPALAWEFTEDTERVDVAGWSQGAIMEVGDGRVAVFGEAAMFSAQVSGPTRIPMGMNAPIAAGNPQFLVNLMRWLARVAASSGR